MSKALLICPSCRNEVAELSKLAPLAAVPFLGESLVEYWLTHLALAGVKEVRILADDRPEHISKLVADGARWGIKADVSPELRELTPAQAHIKYAREFPFEEQYSTNVLDHFPGAPQSPLFSSYANLFQAITQWIPTAKTVDRVGVHEAQPGIWLGLHAHISPSAQLRPPCWIGQSAFIGAKCVVGPNAVIEDRSFVEAGAEIVGSVIGPDTFVGRLAALQKSFAWGNTLVNWENNSVTRIPDAFLLCALRRPANVKSSPGFMGRLFEVLFTEERPPADDLETINQQERVT